MRNLPAAGGRLKNHYVLWSVTIMQLRAFRSGIDVLRVKPILPDEALDNVRLWIKSLAFRPRWLRRLSGSISSSTVWTHKLSLSVDNTEPFAVCLDAAERCSTILEVECPMAAHSRDICDAGLVACWLSAPPSVLYWPVLSENNEILDLIITKKQEYISVTPSCRTHCEESTTISFLFVEIRMVPNQITFSNLPTNNIFPESPCNAKLQINCTRPYGCRVCLLAPPRYL